MRETEAYNKMMDEDLSVNWFDSAWIPMLHPSNIMDYFARSRFYDRTCNNETLKMQRQSMDQLVNMTGVEYNLVHTQPPILYIIRKQHRHDQGKVTPMAHYYVIAGIVYKSPDLQTLVNSRMMNTSFALSAALNKAIKLARYHPSKGYWWDFSEEKTKEGEEVEPPKEQASWFQRQRVDLLLGELVRQYPMKVALPPAQPPDAKTEATEGTSTETKPGTKRELQDSDASTGQPSNKIARVKTERE